MSFWEGETCEYCGGAIVEKRVTLHRKVKGKHVWIENVPAGVCIHCGTRNYFANVLKTIEEDLKGHRPVEREVLAPVYTLYVRIFSLGFGVAVDSERVVLP